MTRNLINYNYYFFSKYFILLKQQCLFILRGRVKTDQDTDDGATTDKDEDHKKPGCVLLMNDECLK